MLHICSASVQDKFKQPIKLQLYPLIVHIPLQWLLYLQWLHYVNTHSKPFDVIIELNNVYVRNLYVSLSSSCP